MGLLVISFDLQMTVFIESSGDLIGFQSDLIQSFGDSTRTPRNPIELPVDLIGPPNDLT